MGLRLDLPRGRYASAAIVLLFLLGACHSGESAHRGWIGSIDTVDDTVTVTTTLIPGNPWPPVTALRPPDTVWASDQLVRPTVLVAASDTSFYVVDAAFIYLIDATGTVRKRFGGKGKGPGEFEGIHGLAAWGEDSLMAWDGALQRLTWLSGAGEVLRTQTVTSDGKHLSPRSAPLEVRENATILARSSGLVAPGGPADSLVLEAVNLSTGIPTREAVVEGLSWVNGQGIVGPKDPFGPRALFAIAPDGGLAISNGVKYCIVILYPDAGRLPRHICRSWMPPPTSNLLDPPTDAVKSLGPLGDMLVRLQTVQQQSAHWNSIEEMLFDSTNRLWVRVVDSSYRYHPVWLRQLPNLRPSNYRWEVFDADGRLSARFDVPSRFEPLNITAKDLLGTIERDDGTKMIGRIPLQ